MIVQEHYSTRNDGVRLIRTYSDLNMYIQSLENGLLYEEAVDPENFHRQYIEVPTPIPSTSENSTNNDSMLEALKILLGTDLPLDNQGEQQ